MQYCNPCATLMGWPTSDVVLVGETCEVCAERADCNIVTRDKVLRHQLGHLAPVVQGFCPMGCGETLRLNPNGRVFCLDPRCADENAVFKILSDSETTHVIRVGNGGRTIKHPLRERVEDDLLYRCDINHEMFAHVQHLDPGVYRWVAGDWRYVDEDEHEGEE